jgi:hypothetical protein
MESHGVVSLRVIIIADEKVHQVFRLGTSWLSYGVHLPNDKLGLFIYSTKACLHGKTPPRLGHLAPTSEVAGGHTLPF